MDISARLEKSRCARSPVASEASTSRSENGRVRRTGVGLLAPAEEGLMGVEKALLFPKHMRTGELFLSQAVVPGLAM